MYMNELLMFKVICVLSSMHGAAISWRGSPSHALALTRILTPHTTRQRFCHLSLNTHMHNHSFRSTLLTSPGYKQYIKVCQSRILFLPIDRSPHLICHIVWVSQDAFFSAQWPPLWASLLDCLLILYALSIILSLSQTHRWHDKQLQYTSLKVLGLGLRHYE